MKLTKDLCTTRWTINGNLKPAFKKKMNEPNFMAWYYLNKVKCLDCNKVDIASIQQNYFIGLNNKEIKEYKKQYKEYGKKGIYYYKSGNNWIYIFKNKDKFKKFLLIKDNLSKNNYKKIKDILKENKFINDLYFKNKKEKILFLYNVIRYFLMYNDLKNLKIFIKLIYYRENYRNYNKNISNYKNLYIELKKVGVEKKFNFIFSKLFKLFITLKFDNITTNIKYKFYKIS